MGERHLSRRGFVTGGLAAVLTGCASMPEQPTPSSTTTVPPGWTPSPSPEAPPPSPVVVPPYSVLAGEVEPACKEAAVAAVAAALTWRDGATEPAAAVDRLEALGSPPAAVATLPPLLGGSPWSSAEIVYPQYGGLVRDLSSASVLVVGEQLLAGDEDVVRRPFTLDVRLVHPASGWQATEILLAPTPPPAPTVSAAASALLTNDRVVLPAAARADLESGLIDDLVPTLLVQLAERWKLTVQVLSTGHPFTVFGTDRQSNHTRGRAVDVWAINDVPVIDHARSAWRAVMEAAAELGSDEIGGPEDIDGVRGRPYFSDQVHQDHVHLGFEPDPPTPS
ncbi:MAG TPA: hypothetical protein VFD41_13725 [Actinomycetales bacterium]|nr:hypothetical protein [Actinomycetales bacterium]